MKKFTNSPEKNHLVSNIKEIFAKKLLLGKKNSQMNKWKKDKKIKKSPEFFFSQSITWFCKLKKYFAFMKKINNSPTKTEYKRNKRNPRKVFPFQKKKNSPEKKITWFQTLKKYLQKTAVEKKRIYGFTHQRFFLLLFFPLERGFYFDWLNSWQDVTHSLDLMVDE